VAGFYLVRTTHRFSYELIPSALELVSFYDQSKDYYRSVGAEFKADENFEIEMRRAYAEASSKNLQNNISKAGFLYRAQMGLVSAALFLAVSGVPYFASEIGRPPSVQRIEVVNELDAK
jgi:hypothetical protein